MDLLISAVADENGVRHFAEDCAHAKIDSGTLSSEICTSLQLAIQTGDKISEVILPSKDPAASFLAMPLMYLGDILGAVYLENRRIAGLYSSNSGAQLINVLVSQVASQLYRNNVIRALEQNQKDLISAKSALEAAVKMKDRFLSTISHELRTPFNSILGFISLMLEYGLTDQQYSMAESIQSSSRNLLSIINE